ncbi:Cytosolic iron-sulfur protein assembly protein [Acarospora aff. strigata]|nr:Cytosolic iron-sulfur protein assembly protein [Acarospora aff. strigata]
MTAPASSNTEHTSANGTGIIGLLSPLTPPSLARSWFTAPHPHLPLVATCSSDKSVRIYSLTSFTLLSTISGGHKRSVRSCAWNPSVKGESVLATGSFDASVGIWRRWDNGEMNPKPARTEGMGSADGEIDMTNGLDGSVGHENDEEDEDDEWRFAVVLDGHESEVKSVAWSTGGNFLATCSRDKSVWIWEEMEDDNFETIAVLQEHEGDVKCVVWHPEEELLASASYDDTIRLYKERGDDWECVSILKGHDSTVWALDFEPVNNPSLSGSAEHAGNSFTSLATREASGPRLISSSDDQTIRVWRRIPQEKAKQDAGPRIPSIYEIDNGQEFWVQESELPKRHERAIYSVAWSKRTGRVVSTGGDGKIVVYEERWKSSTGSLSPTEANGDAGAMEGVETNVSGAKERASEWVVLAEIEGAHGVFEINHVSWAKRADKGRRTDEEEVILSTGDDGVVRVWTLDLN